MKGKIIVMGLLVILLFSSLAFGFESHNTNGSENKNVKGYASHNVIRINSNADFTLQNGVVGGSGTQSDPYIISSWDIDAHGAGNSIYIGNTTAYFIVEDCYLHNTSSVSYPYFESDGITLYKVQNGTIKNNVISNNWNGVDIYYSQSNVIENNTIYNSENGVYFWYSNNSIMNNNNISNSWEGTILISSSDNVIENNTIYNNTDEGIFIYWNSNSTVIKNNKIYGNGNGIFLYSSSSNKLYGNNMTKNGIILSGYKNTFTTQDIPSNNTVNGKSLYYYKNANMNNATTPVNAGEIILGNVTYFRIENLAINNTFVAIEIGYSFHICIYNTTIRNDGYGLLFYSSVNNTIENSIIRDNRWYGILIVSSNYNVIRNNTILNNGRYGVYIYSGSYNLIYNNSFFYNHGSGDSYNSLHLQASDNGTNNQWNVTGIGNYWRDWANNNDTNDQNGDGIVDWPYKIDGTANVVDHFPLKNTSVKLPPLPPWNLNATAGYGYVNLTWDAPCGNGTSSITEYKIYKNGVFIASVPANQLYYNDTNVVNGQTYTYYVTAVNSIGESAKSNEVQATPGSEIPEFSTGIWMAILIIISLLAVMRFRKS